MAVSLLLNSCKNPCTSYRCASSSYRILYRNESHHRKKILKRPEVKQLRSFMVDRYFNFVSKYNSALDKRFPTAMRIYRSFVNGCHEFFGDMKKYVGVYKTINRNGFKGLKRHEIELYYQMKRDMRKVAPVLLVSTLPMANYFIFPLIYMYPKQLLTSHFWSLQQRSEFGVQMVKERLAYQKPVFRCLQSALVGIESSHPLYTKWEKILGLIGSGRTPCVQDIIECEPFFAKEPYTLASLGNSHLRKLLRLHGIRGNLFFKRAQLSYRARVLKEMDLAMQREGDLTKLPSEELRHICLIRGLNPSNMSNEDLLQFLYKWLEISNASDKTTYSLLLHIPVLLTYNHPNNWMLLYK